ncbi:MAG: hypothetical protein HFG70_10305 [Hungatella sp.]|nr:hypothetical protein [Hungatella sp.]
MVQATIVIGITIVMAVFFFTGWLPIIATAFCVPMLLQLTGVLTFNEAWSGFANSTVISFIPIFTMAAVLKKSSFIYRLKEFVKRLNGGKNGKFKVMFALVCATFLLTTFMNAASATAVMTPIILSVAGDVGLSRKKALKICSDVSSNSILVLPLGLTLTQYLTYNAYLEAGGADAGYMFDIMDQTLLKAPIFIIWLLIMIFLGNRFCLIHEDATIDVNKSDKGEEEEIKTTLTPLKDKLAVGLFFGSVTAMILCAQIWETPIYLTCGLFCIAAIALKIININDAIASMSWVSILIIACTLPLATAFNKTGASDIFAGLMNVVVGGTNNIYILAAVFFLVPAVLTHFMSNMACSAVFSPLAVAAGVSLGLDPRFLLVAAQMGAFSAFMTPMSTACEAITFEAGHFKMGEFAKAGLFPIITWFILFMIWFPICSQIFF